MQAIYLFVYNFLIVPLFHAGFFLGGMFNSKIKQGVEGRKSYFQNLESKLDSLPPDSPRILIHATSVGEWLQAQPIIAEIKKQNPNVQIIMSFFSPSGYNYVKDNPLLDVKVYLPLDSKRKAKRFFKSVHPDLWIISKFDIWPNHVIEASKRQIPIVIIAATLSEDSGRNKGAMKAFSRKIYQHFSWIFPISEDDKQRFSEIYSNQDRLIVTGDTRFDSVFNRAEATRKNPLHKVFKDDSGLNVIAGSIWPADEKHVLPAFLSLYKAYDTIKLILVPHELHESHIQSIESFFTKNGIPVDRYTSLEEDNKISEKRVLIVNTIGMLASLYRQSHLAYVGGSFGKGVHNVMEPAAFGQPVIFGPNHVNSFEALELKKIGCAFEVNSSKDILDFFSQCIEQEEYRGSIGDKARDLIEENRGATQKIMSILHKNYDFIS